MPNRYHEANRNLWNASASSWARRADGYGIWKRCHQDPSLALHEAELKWLQDVHGKTVAVLGSGDNRVVFALSGLGAKVTSVDFSEQQLTIARQRAAEIGLDVRFVLADVTDLSGVSDETFDITYTGGHVAVWVSDLARFYAEAARILKVGGLFVSSEYHPFRRVWKDSPDRFELSSNYFDRGPRCYTATRDLLKPVHGNVEQFEFHWTVGDYLSAVLAAGCQIVHVEEFGDGREEWEGAPLAGLPARLLIVSKRTRIDNGV